MVAAGIFDIDNTLYDHDPAHKSAFGRVPDSAPGLAPEQFLELHRGGDRLLRSHTGGGCAAVHNRLIRYQLLLEQLERPLIDLLPTIFTAEESQL